MDNEDCNCSVEGSIALLEKQVNKLESVARNNYEQLQSLRIGNFPGSGADTAEKLELLCIEDCKLSMPERYALLKKRLTKLYSEVRNNHEQLQSLRIENLPGSGADTAERKKLSMI